MDEDVSKLLLEWGLAAYIETFATNNIDIYTLGLLDSNLASELIRPIGDRARFLKNLETWKQLANSNIEVLEVSQDGKDIFVDTLNPKHRNIHFTSSLSTSIDHHSPLILDDLTNTSLPVDEESICSEHTEKPLKNLLKRSLEGKGLLNLYLEEGKLSNHGRRHLCNIIIKDLLSENPEKRISSQLLFEKAQEIKDLFPKENISTYFIPYINNRKLKIKRCAKGKLYDCLQNRRRDYRNSHIIQNQKLDTDLEDVSNDSCSTHLDEDDYKDDINWLQNSCEPWNIVIEKWRKTSAFRTKEVNSLNYSINSYMNKYPALKKPLGFNLLVEDFGRSYPQHKNKLYNNFPLYRKKILEFARKKFANSQDITIKHIIDQQLSECVTDDAPEANSVAAFMLLPLLLGNPLAKNRKGTWRPSKQECRDGFITHVSRYMDLQQNIDQRKEKFLKLGVTLQPTIFIVGPNISAVEKYFIIVNDTYYHINSIIESVDVCFKIFHSLHCQYPIESVCVWSFIQKAFFNLETKWDKNYSTVNALITDLEIELGT